MSTVAQVTELTVEARPSQDYQGTAASITVSLGSDPDPAQIKKIHGSVSELVNGLARKHLDQLVQEKQSREKQAARRQQDSTRGSTNDGGSSDGYTIKRASKPEGRGTLTYVPTDELTPDELKAMVKVALKDAGEDPSLFVVYDERVGTYGIESGNKRWSAITVKTTDRHPAHDDMVEDDSTKAAYYGSFEDDASVSIHPSSRYEDAVETLQDVLEQDSSDGGEPSDDGQQGFPF